ncbi:MAG TPA: terminase family protein [Egibacteraceae bacterium]|nr:terminase family protein [Egibacteraceae bacterium]
MNLLEDLAGALDPLALAREVGLTLDAWQRQVLLSTSPRLLLCCGRQVGKSTVSGLKALHGALYQPGSLVLLISPSLRQSGELFRKVSEFHAALRLEALGESTLKLELPNGSRVISLPGSEGTVRGYSAASLIVLDEAARVPDELLAAVRPMLATSRGTLVALSTPAGRRGWFHEAWTRGENWERYQVRSEECPRITGEFLREEREALGPMLYAQEYLADFVDDGSQAFPTALVDAALSAVIKPLWPEVQPWH